MDGWAGGWVPCCFHLLSYCYLFTDRKFFIQRPSPATVLEMTKFHTDDYIDFLKRVTPESLDDVAKHQQKCK